MIERTTSCLSRGGRSISTRSKASRHTCRSLHSSFWNHGAGDIGLPPWWNTFIHQPNAAQSPVRGNNHHEAHTLQSSFLDFLYPPKTIEFAKRLDARRLRQNTTGRKRLFMTSKRQERSQNATALAPEKVPAVDLYELDAIALRHVESEDNRPLWTGEQLDNSKDQAGHEDAVKKRVKTRAKQDEDRPKFPRSNRMGKTATNLEMSPDLIARKSGSNNNLKGIDEQSQVLLLPADDQAGEDHGTIDIDNPRDKHNPNDTAVDGIAASQATDRTTTVSSKPVLASEAPETAPIKYWRSQSKQLGEMFEEYTASFDTTMSLPQIEDDFASTFSSETSLLVQQLESTLNTGTKFLDRFMQHVEQVIFPVNRMDWTEKQWAFFIGLTLHHPKRLPATRQRAGIAEKTLLASQRGVFRLLREAAANNKAITAIRESLVLAIARQQVDFANYLLIFCHKQKIDINLVISDLASIESPLLVRWIAGLIERIEIPRWLDLQTKLDPLIQSDRQSYLDLIYLMMEYVLRRSLSVDVNAATYEKAWTTFQHYDLLDTRHFLLALDQLIGVESSDSVDLTAFINVAYKLFNAASQRPDFKIDVLQVQALLRKLTDTHHPRSWEVFQYYRKTFGFDGDIYKIMLQELSYAGEAEHWQEVFEELKSKEENIDKAAWIHQLLIAYSKRANIVACKSLLGTIATDLGRFPDLASWNAVLHAYIQADNMVGALEFHKHMKERGVQHDVSTSMVLLRGYAARGETVQVSDLVAQITSEGHPLTAKMVYHLVFAHLNDEDMDGAERILHSAADITTDDSMIDAWNAVLTSYAHQGRTANINYIHNLMHQHGLKDNVKTYAALMLGFANTQNVPSATNIISDVMPMYNMVPTIHHYNILLQLLVRKGEFELTLKTYQALKKQHLKPDIVTQKLALRAVASMHGRITKGRPGWRGVETRALAQAEEFLRQNLELDTPQHIVSASPLIGRDGQPMDQAFASLQFSSLIMDEGKNWTNEQMITHFNKYQDFYRKKYPGQDIIVPIRMHTAVAEHYMSMNDFDGIINLWHQALSTLSSFAAITNADPTKPNWILRSRSTLLGPIFRPYMIVLLKRKQYTLLDRTIRDLTTAGWRFSSSMWNTYITHLAQLGNLHLALTYCEQHLIAGFPGWPPSTAYGKTPKYEIERASHGSLRWQIKKPNYETLVWLARAYTAWRTENAFSLRRSEGMAELVRGAPVTWEVVTRMPRVDDVEQNLILRNPKYGRGKMQEGEEGEDVSS